MRASSRGRSSGTGTWRGRSWSRGGWSRGVSLSTRGRPLELASDGGCTRPGRYSPPERRGRHAGAGAVALRRLEDAANDSYFAQVSALACARRGDGSRRAAGPTRRPGRHSTWSSLPAVDSRSFWAQGGTGSEPRTLLFRLSGGPPGAGDGANEDSERRALAGELAQLKAAWQRAEEIAAIADSLFDEDAAALQPGVAAPARGLPETLPGLLRLRSVRWRPIRHPHAPPRFAWTRCGSNPRER